MAGNPPCEECGGSSFIHDPGTGETVCVRCGTVQRVDNITDTKIRAFTPEEYDERTTHTPTDAKAFDGGISSHINWSDIKVKGITYDERHKFMRMRRWDRRSKLHESKMRNLSNATDKIRRIVAKLGLPNQVHEEAIHLYRKALNLDLIRGRSIVNVAAACLYLGCRIHKVPRNLKNFEESDKEIDRKQFRTAIRLLLKELKLKPGLHKTTPYIQQCVAKMGFPTAVERLAKEKLEVLVETYKTGGKNPAVLAATLVYVSARELKLRVVQRDVAATLEVTEVSLRNTMKVLREEGLIVLSTMRQ